MGCDGGSIPKRHELVKTKAKPQRPDKNSLVDARWNCCALSKEPLQKPVVACRLGRLYNKDKVLEFLLDRKAFGDGEDIAGHILKTSDVTTLNLTSSPSSQSDGSSAVVGNIIEKAKGVMFVFSVKCGCVLSEDAFKEIPSQACLLCSKPFSLEEDLITINSEKPEEIAKMKALVEQRNLQRLAADAAKKAAKQAKKSGKVADDTASAIATEPSRKRKVSPDLDTPATKKIAPVSRQPSSNINIPLPKLNSKMPVEIERSEAIKSLYLKDKNLPKGNYLTMGTFTRYVSH
ncbi:Protein RTF2 [Phlyctochytrium planicorne]|nr:Protein RTF2 [Phlyctochytrium planicorne]